VASRPRVPPARRQGNHWLWQVRAETIDVRFVGRGPEARREDVLRAVAGSSRLQVAWARQVHSARVLPGRPGECGEADALWTAQAGLALSVATADCVPVLLGGAGVTAAVHAGWRGIAAGVVGETVRALPTAPAGLTAWIGPAIGACCYEVGHEVAEQVVAASRPEVVRPGQRGRPHVDLSLAVAWQLAAVGVEQVSLLTACTRCLEERLWSFRRDGSGTGRNLAFVWRRD
jgi:hypothetical protein